MGSRPDEIETNKSLEKVFLDYNRTKTSDESLVKGFAVNFEQSRTVDNRVYF